MAGSPNTSYVVSENGKKISCERPVLSLQLNTSGVHEFRVQYDGKNLFNLKKRPVLHTTNKLTNNSIITDKFFIINFLQKFL